MPGGHRAGLLLPGDGTRRRYNVDRETSRAAHAGFTPTCLASASAELQEFVPSSRLIPRALCSQTLMSIGRCAALRHVVRCDEYRPSRRTAPGITQICTQLHGSWFHTTCDAVAGTIRQSVGGNNLSPGQVYLLLMLSRGADTPAPLIVKAIESHWAGAPYHLKLALIDAACIRHLSDDGDRAALIATIEALPQSRNIFISSTIVEALQRLGALEDSERGHIAVVLQEIKECLSDPEDADHHSMAYGLYSAQFDHPYSGAYCEAIAELPEDDRKSLLRMAASGVTDSAFFLVALLVDLLSFGDPSLGNSISRWTAMPPTDSFMPQGSIAALVIAHIGLARLGRPLPDRRDVADGHSAEALAACGGNPILVQPERS